MKQRSSRRNRQLSAGRKVSIPRLVGVVAVVAGTGVGLVSLGQRVVSTFVDGPAVTFSPYVDLTLDEANHFEDPLENQADEVTLGFVVADPADACTPSWGTYYSLDAAGRALDLDRRVERYRARDGDVAVSFGGQANDELAIGCKDVEALADAYLEVIDRYSLTTVDFDIEGPALSDHAANARRAKAIAEVQRRLDRPLAVWMTLPVAPTGISDDGVRLLDDTLGAGVELAGLNVMTMNYAESRVAGSSMADASIEALGAARRQLEGAYRRAGSAMQPDEVWAHLGATPMIGQNDVAADEFGLGDAEALMDFAAKVGLGRTSMWSLNRDRSCGVQREGAGVANTCSGVEQTPGEFASIFLARRDAQRTPVAVAAMKDRSTRDDPATSPYPIWRTARAYVEGAKVVWQGGVYEARWWSMGDRPDEPVEQLWDTPWRYLGPVLDSDVVAIRSTPKVVEGNWEEWDGDDVYVAGDEVELDGQVYRASWWTQGDRPELDPDRPFDHPWEHLGEVKDPDAETDDAGAGEADGKTSGP